MKLRVEEYLDGKGAITLPDGYTVNYYLERAVAELGDTFAYRYLDFNANSDGEPNDLTWTQLGQRSQAVAARLQQVTKPGDRVAILAPQGIDYVVGFYAAIEAGNIAVPLFAPELPGHSERLDSVLTDAQPAVVLTNNAAAESVSRFVRGLPRERRPRVVAVDSVPDSVAATYVKVTPDTDDIAYLQYTSGSTRVPAGVEITHRAVMTNVLQMIISVGLDDSIRSVSWLPLYHDMGLLMILFPLCGGRITLMSPVSFVRRPGRWIKELAAEGHLGRTFAAAPNFAFELAAERGLPRDGETLDLSNVAGLINGSEPVSISSIRKFNEAFGPYGLPPTTIKPSYGMAEATLFVSTIPSDAEASVVYLDRKELGNGHAVRVGADDENAVPQVSCGKVARSQWAVIVNPNADAELADGEVGEIWLHGDNIGRGYWGRPKETDFSFRNKLQARLDQGSHATGTAPETWASTWTASSSSPDGSRTWSSSTAATTIRRTSRPPSRKPHPRCGTVLWRPSRCPRTSCPPESIKAVARGSEWSSWPSVLPARAAPSRSPSSMPFARPSRGGTTCPSRMYNWFRPVRFRVPPAESSHAEPAARNTWTTSSACAAELSVAVFGSGEDPASHLIGVLLGGLA
jgi:fatty acid CoA ligase FadD32